MFAGSFVSAAPIGFVPPGSSSCIEWRFAPQATLPGAKNAVVGMTDLGSITVIDFDGDYSRSNALPRQQVARSFLQGRADEYDFLVVFTTFEFDTGDALAFYNPLRNNVQGIGQPVFDNGAAYGSERRMQGIVDMAAVSRYAFDPADARHPQLLNTLAHELMHRWAVGVRFRTLEGVDSSELLGRDGSHWSFFVDSDGSVMYGNDWQALPGGRFRSVRVQQQFSALDLYLGGFLAADEVPPTTLLRGAAGDAASLPQLGAEVGASVEAVSVAQIVAAEGVRSPAAGVAPKVFRAGLVLLKRPGEEVPARLIGQLERLRANFQQRFTAMTGGRGALRFGNLPRRLASQGLPAIVLPSALSGVDAQVQAGLDWLRMNQQMDGRFEDNPGTVLRDTAYAVMALSELAPGDAAIDRARTFLQSAPAATLEEHAWRAAGLPLDRSLSIDAVEALDRDGVFRLAPGLEPGLLDTQLAVDLIAREDPSPTRWHGFAARSGAWQGVDGAFGVHPGGAPSLRSTALAVANLALVDRTGAQAALVRDRGRNWLVARQASDGGFGNSLSESLEIFVRQPSIALPEPAYNRLRSWVRGRQGTGGDFGGSVYATSLALLALTRDSAPNLAVAGPLRFDPPSPVDGAMVRVLATIENRGGGTAAASRIRIYDGAPLVGGTPVGAAVLVPSLVPGGRATVAVVFDTRGRAGARMIHAVVDADNEVAESSEGDNDASAVLVVAAAPAGVELALSEIDLAITPPRIDSVPVEVVVAGILRNLGASPATSVLVQAMVDEGLASEQDEVRIDVPAQGSTPFELRFVRGVAGRFRLRVVADADGAFAEPDETNNAILRDVSAGQGVDLLLPAGGIQVASGPPVTGQPMRLGVAVENRGASDAPPALLQATVVVAGERTNLPAQSVQVAGGGRETREFTWTPTAAGPVRFEVVVDPANAIAELDEDNNRIDFDTIVASDSGVNLAIEDGQLVLDPMVPREAGPLTARVRIRNLGADPAPPYSVALYAGDPRLAGRELARIDMPGLASGALQVAETMVVALDARGDTTFYFAIDADGAIAESNESDNFALRTVPVLALADLAVGLADVTMDPSRPVSGEPVTATVRVRNIGQQPAASFAVRLSELGTASAAVAPDRILAGLEPGAVAELVWTWTLGSDPAPTTLVVEVDPAGVIAEGTESNNRLDVPLELQDGSVFASQRWFSPNDDGVKDQVRVAWRLAVVEQVQVVVRNARGSIVRRFPPQSVARGEVTWDGRNDRGRVVPDGDYRIEVLGGGERRIGALDATVDTNRSTAIEAIDTPRARIVSLPPTIPPNGAGWRFGPRGSASRYAVFARAARPPAGGSPPRFVGLYRSDTLFPALQAVLSQEWVQRFTAANGDYAGEVLDFWIMPDGQRILFLLRTEVSFGPYRYMFGTVRADAVDNPTLLGSLQTFPAGRVPFVEGVLDGNTVLVRWPVGSGFERRLLDVRTGIGTTFAMDVPLAASVAAAFAQGVAFRTGDGDGERWFFAPRSGDAARDLGSWPGAVLSPDRKALAGIRDDGATQSVWLVALDSPPSRPLVSVDRVPFVFAPDNIRYPDQLTMSWIARANELMVVDAAASRVSFFTSAGQALDAVPLAIHHGPLEPLDAGSLWIASADTVHRGRNFSPSQERCEGAATWLAERPVHQNFDAGNETLSLAIARVVAVRRAEPESGELVPDVVENGLAWQNLDLFGGVANAGSGSVPAWMFGDGSHIGCDGSLWTSSGAQRRERWDLAPAVLDVSPDEDALLLSAAAGAGGPPSGGRVLGSFLNLPTVLRAENVGRAIRLYGLVADRQFERWELEWAHGGAASAWQSVTSSSSTEVLADDFMYWTPPEPGTYLVRLRAFDRAGNVATSVVQVVSQFAADIGQVRAEPRALSPNGDGVQDMLQVDYVVRRAATVRIEVQDAAGVARRAFVRAVGDGEIGPATWTWDGRADDGTVVADGRYTLWINEQRLPLLVDTQAPTGEPRLLAPFDASNGHRAVLQLEPPGRPRLQDANLALLALEYQDGATWRTLQEIPVGKTTQDVALEDYAGRTFRLRAVDRAGNRSLFPLGEAVEELTLVARTALWRVAPAASRPRLEHFTVSSNRSPFAVPPDAGTRALLPEAVDLDLLEISSTAQGLVEIEYQTAPLATDPAWRVRARIAMDAGGADACARLAITPGACPLTGSPAHWQYADAVLDPVALAESRPSLVRVVGRRADGSQLASNWIRFDPDSLQFELSCASASPAPDSLVPPFVRDALLREAGISREDVGPGMRFAGFGLLAPDGLRSLDRIAIGTVDDAATVLAEQSGGALVQLSQQAQAEIEALIAQQRPATALARLTTRIDGLRAVATVADRCESPQPATAGVRALVLPLLGAECAATPSNGVQVRVATTTNGTVTLRRIVVAIRDPATGIELTVLDREYSPSITLGSVDRNPFFVDIGTNGLPAGSAEALVRVDVGRGLEALEPAPFSVDRVPGSAAIFEPLPGTRICATRVAADQPLSVPMVGAFDGGNPGPAWAQLGVGESAAPLAWNENEKPLDGPSNGPLGGVVVERGTSANPTWINGLATVRVRAWDWSGAQVCAAQTVEVDSILDASEDRRASLGPVLETLTIGEVLGLSGRGRFQSISLPYRLGERVDFTLTLHALAQADVPGSALVDAPLATVQEGFADPPVLRLQWDGVLGGQPLAEGVYGLRLVLNDACGFSRRFEYRLRVDRTPPTVSVSQPTPAATLGGLQVEVRGSVDDPRLARWQVLAGSAAAGSVLAVVGEGHSPVPVAARLAAWNRGSQAGPATIALVAEDALDNIARIDVPMVLDAPSSLLVDGAVLPALFSPNGDGVRESSRLEIVLARPVRATVRVLDDAGAQLRVLANEASLAAGAAAWTWDGRAAAPTPAPDGDYRFELLLVDAAQPAASESARFAVAVDTTAPVLLPLNDGAPFVPGARPIGARISDAGLESYQLVLRRDADGAEVARAAGSDPGEIVLTSSDALDESAYRLVGSATDRAGNTARMDHVFVVDRTPPLVQIVAPAEAAVLRRGGSTGVTGAAEDTHLDRWELRLTRVGAPAATLAEGTEPITAGTAVHAWSVQAAEGDARLLLSAIDRAGNSAMVERAVAIDGTPPIAVITTPVDGSAVRGDLRIVGSATDTHFHRYRIAIAPASGPSSGQFSDLFEGESPVVASPLFEASLSRPEGEYLLRLTVDDRAGHSSSTSIAVRIDNQPPPAPSGLVATPVDNRDVVLDWDDVVASDLAGYRVYRNGTALPVLAAQSSLRDVLAPEGRLRYAVTAVDRAGNESVRSLPAEAVLDRTPPIVTLTRPLDGELVGGVVAVRGSVVADGDLSAWRLLRSLEPGGAPEVLADGAQERDDVVLADWDTQVQVDQSAHRLTLESVDRAGNRSAATVQVTVDNGPPAVPQGLAASANGSDIALDWTANTESDLLGYLVYRDGVLLTAVGAPPPDLRPYAVPDDAWLDEDVGDGTRRYRVRAIDRAGNISAPSEEAVVELDTTPPRLTLVEPVPEQRFDDAIRLRAQSPDTDIVEVEFAWREPGGSWSTIGAPLASPPWTVEWAPVGLAFGPYELRARARDAGGRVDPQPPVVTVRFADLTPPEPPTDVRALADGLLIRTTWEPSPSSDVALYRVYRGAGIGGTPLAELPASARDHQADAQGSWDVVRTVVAVDGQGNVSAVPSAGLARIFTPQWTEPFTPVVSAAITASGRSFTGGTAQLTALSSSGTTQFGPVAVDGDGRFVFDGVALAPGENRLDVRVTDADGNRSLPAQTFVDRAILPGLPENVVASLVDRTATVTWTPRPQGEAIGYRVFRNGNPLLGDADTPALTATSPQLFQPFRAIDENPQTFTEVPPGFDGQFDFPLVIELRAPAIENLVGLRISTTDASRRVVAATIEAWSGRRWVRVAAFSGNDAAERFVPFDIVYRTQRVRLLLDRVPPLVGAAIAELDLVRRPMVAAPPVERELPDGRHLFRVSAIEGHAFEGPRADAMPIDVGDAEAPMPVVLSGSVLGSDAVLDWTASASPDVAAYIVRRDGIDVVRLPAAGERRHVDVSRPNGAYDYVVVAVDGYDNASAPSNVVRLSIDAALPGAPQWVSLAPLPEGRSVQLDWQAGSGAQPADYVLERADAVDGPFVPIATQAATTFRDPALVDGRSYHYRVSARDAAGNRGAASEVRSVVPRDATAPLPPRLNVPLPAGVEYRTARTRVAVCGSTEPDARIELRSDRGATMQARATAGWGVRSVALELQANLGSAIAHDGRAMFVSEYGRGAVVVDLDSGQVAGRSPVSAQHAAVSTDGWTIWYVDPQSASIRTLDMQTLETRTASEDFEAVDQLLMAPDGRHLLVVGRRVGELGDAAWLLDVDDATSVRVDALDGFATVGRMRWSPDATRFMMADPGNGRLVVWGLDGSRQETPLDGILVDAHWLPDGTALLALQALDGGVLLREVQLGTGATVDRFGFPVPVWEFALDPTGRFAALGSEQRVDIVDVATGMIVRTEPGAAIVGWSGGHRLVLLRDGLQVIDTPGAFCVREFPLQAGVQQIDARARDTAGNEGAWSAPVAVRVAASELPDLAIAGGDLRATPASGRVGDSFTAVVTVRNRGQSESPSAPVVMRLTSPVGVESILQPQTVGNIAAGGSRTLEFPLGALDAPGTWTLRATVDGGNAVVESDEANNTAQRSIAVSASGAPVLELALGGDLLAPDTPLAASLVVTNPGATFDGLLRAEVIDDSGDAIAEVLALPVSGLSFGQRREYGIAWPTLGRPGGDYRLRATLRGAGGATVSSAEAAFTIDVWRAVMLDVAVPAGPLILGDSLAARVRVEFRSGNAPLPDAQLDLAAFAPDGALIGASLRALGALNPGFEALVPFDVPTVGVAPGPLRITARLVSGAFESSAERTVMLVDAAAPMVLSGSLALEPEGDVQLGRDALLRWTVRNGGSIELPSVDVRMRVFAGAGTILERTSTDPIAPGGVVVRSEDLGSSTLVLGAYRAVLEARLPGDAAGNWRLLASLSLPVTDGEPPRIDAIEPDGSRPVAPPVVLRARVVDRHAGVDRVEAQVDNGSWRTMFGTVDGRYSREADALADGPHRFRLRAFDRYGNQVELPELVFDVDGTPPEVSITGVVDGQVGSQDVLPTIAITDANPDPAQDLLRLDGLPYMTGTAISAEGERVLLVGAVDRAGNRSQRVMRFTIDRTPPALQFLSPVDGAVTTATNVDVRLASEPGARVVLRSGAFVAESDVSTSGEALFAAVPLQLGANALRAQARDAAANQSPERSITVVRNETGSGSLVGTIQAAPTVDRGDDLAVALQVRNDTGLAVIQQRFRLRVFGPGGAPLLETRESVRDLAVGATISEVYALPTATWPLGQAALLLDAEIAGAWQQLDASVVDVADGSPPLLALLAPVADAVSRNPVRVEANASDPGGPPPSVRARIDLGAWLDLVPDPVDASRFARDLLPLPEGQYRLDVEARDAAGNATAAPPRNFSVDETPPVITFGGIAEGAASNAASVVPTIAVVEAHPDTLIATLDGQPWTSGTPVVDEGPHRIDASAVDRAGNASTATLHFTLDRTAPVVGITSPPEGAVVAVDRVTVSGATEAGASVRLSNGAYSVLLSTDADGLFVAPDVPLSVGDNAIDANATDRAGNIGPVATRVVRYVPDAGGTLQATLAVTPTEGDPGTTVVADWSLRNAGPTAVSGVPVRLVFQQVGGPLSELIRSFDVTLASGAEFSDSTELATVGRPLGAHEVVVEARLAAGDGSLVWTRIADAPYAVVDRTPPLVAFATPAAASVHGATIDVQLDASDAASAITSAEARIIGGPWVLLSAQDGMPGRFTGRLDAVADGPTTLEARATDAAGQVGQASPRPVTIDREPPQIAITGVPAEDPPVNVPVIPAISVVDATAVETTITVDGAAYTPGTPIDGDGLHVLRVIATDAAGNVAESEARFTIDRTPPLVTVTQPPPGTQTPQIAILVAGVTEPGAQVRVTVGTIQRETVADPKGGFSIADVPLALGSNTVTAAARDRAGNEGAPVSVVVVRTGPPQPQFEGRIELLAKIWQAGEPLPVPASLRNTSAAAAPAARFRMLVQALDGGVAVAAVGATLDVAAGGTAQQQFDFATFTWPQTELRLLLQHDRGSTGVPDWVVLDDHVLALVGQCFQAQLFADGFESGTTPRLFIDGFESCAGATLPARPIVAASTVDSQRRPAATAWRRPAPPPPSPPPVVAVAGPRPPTTHGATGATWAALVVTQPFAKGTGRA